jgi:predicted lipoprotein with Yx(FWY)xxD motif
MELGTPIRRVLVAAVLTVALAAAALANGATAATSVKPLVSTAKNADLGKTVLVNRKGLTLYSLSVERHGKFICTDSECLSFWTPLTVEKGAKPTGTAGLATVQRPDGRTQVTYRGGPLYTFYLDHARGDDGGEGFKDVGIWHAAAAKRAT